MKRLKALLQEARERFQEAVARLARLRRRHPGDNHKAKKADAERAIKRAGAEKDKLARRADRREEARAGGRVKPNIVLTRSVRNQSSRAGVRPRLIVLHSTESHNRPGTSDLGAVAAWFDNPGAQASSHVIDDADGNSARCVPDEAKAWTCAAFNAVSLNIEQIGFASQGVWPELQLDETARWIAAWAKKYGIPIARGAVSGAQVTRSGVVTHAELGSAGGGHHDPGADFPLNRALAKASVYRARL